MQGKSNSGGAPLIRSDGDGKTTKGSSWKKSRGKSSSIKSKGAKAKNQKISSQRKDRSDYDHKPKADIEQNNAPDTSSFCSGRMFLHRACRCR